ncbi:hypothetical protein, partial [Candidatus Rhabdochlamydia sp. W815]|uniref:hypothetical protein n=1 Tax=Candidatus Rhabdochlamydia sp. W815 TaxID=2720721 RepID=UPI001BFC09A7
IYKHAMLGCTIDVFSSIYMFFFVHFKVERAYKYFSFLEVLHSLFVSCALPVDGRNPYWK